MRVRLVDIATVIRSKNSGPYELTLDIIFADAEWHRRVVDAGVISRSLISGLYDIPEHDVLKIVSFEPAHAIKVTLRRPRVAGDVGETDVYGAQQHAPLLDLHLEVADSD